MAVNNFVLGGFYPLGLVLQGALADATSLRAVTIGSGVALAVTTAAVFAVNPRRSDPITTLDRGGREPAIA
jgi:hypothetical protein